MYGKTLNPTPLTLNYLFSNHSEVLVYLNVAELLFPKLLSVTPSSFFFFNIIDISLILMKYFINRSYNKRAKKWRTQSPVSKTVKSTLNKMFIHEAISKLHQNSIWRGKKIIEYTINTWKITVWTAPIHLHLGFFFFA